MIAINLLPHRELKRAARQRQMLMVAGGVLILGALTVLLVHSAINGMIDNQAARNQMLKDEMARLDKDIEEIKKLKDTTKSLLDRKKVVEDLQTNRAQEVHLLDQMVRQLPDGMYLKSIKQQGNVITLQGYAQSNARVSTLLRNLEASPWLESPDLNEIKRVTVNGVSANEFTLTVKLSQPGQDDESKPGRPQASVGGNKP
jgi:type IV pilus assembly protein PilN